MEDKSSSCREQVARTRKKLLTFAELEGVRGHLWLSSYGRCPAGRARESCTPGWICSLKWAYLAEEAGLFCWKQERVRVKGQHWSHGWQRGSPCGQSTSANKRSPPSAPPEPCVENWKLFTWCWCACPPGALHLAALKTCSPRAA